ncbi:MAG: N-acetylglucosamine-6-phosphate deacetylase [Gemmataceae bacterium]|nr:N-acetylglucosamine-6-phosphate deacetylase [Gemmataceae bacterium]
MHIHARHYATGEAVELTCEQGRITAITPASAPTDRWVAPALFDLQINGCDGESFSSEKLTVDTVRHVVAVCRQHGVSGLCPTLVTNSFEALSHGMATIRRACDTHPEVARAVPGIHLEGPYLSPDDGPRGAHPRQHIRPPNWDEFCRLQDAAGGRIRLVTVAPEHEGALAFIEKLVASRVVVALGHTAATGLRIRDAAAAGARLSTHLGNGSHAMLPRHDNYIWEQLACDDLWASIICDGHHLPSTVARCIMRVKTPARTVLTCDAGGLAGLPAGRYREWDQDFDVLPEGKIVVAGTPYLAGSWAFTDLCVGNAMRFGGVSLRDAVDMAGARPRELLGLPARPLEVGAPAELMVFDWEEGGPIQVRDVVIP